MKLPGSNQTQSIERRRRVLPSEILFAQRPVQLRIMTAAAAKYLQIDKPSREAGFADAAASRPFNSGAHDGFSYSSGYVAGLQFGRSKGD